MNDVYFATYNNYTNFNDNNNNNSQTNENDSKAKDLIIYQQQTQILDLKANLEQLKIQQEQLIDLLNLFQIDTDILKFNLK
jgi:hypothetical protein